MADNDVDGSDEWGTAELVIPPPKQEGADDDDDDDDDEISWKLNNNNDATGEDEDYWKVVEPSVTQEGEPESPSISSTNRHEGRGGEGGGSP